MFERDTLIGIPLGPWRELDVKISFHDAESLVYAMDTQRKFILTSVEPKQGMIIMTGLVFNKETKKYEERMLNFDSEQSEGLNKWLAKSGVFSKRIRF